MFHLLSELPAPTMDLKTLRPFYEDFLKTGHRPVEVGSPKAIFLINFPKDVNGAYLWERDPPREAKDDYDREFLKQKNGSLKHAELYGLHTYGGYPLFFRPDLVEVAKLIEKAGLKGTVFFVTTEPCDLHGNLTDNVGDCYDNKKDRHMAKTTVFYVEN